MNFAKTIRGNYLYLGQPNETGSNRTIEVKGNQTDINLLLNAKGVGKITLNSSMVLGTKSSDPGGSNGELYYNTTNNKFRLFENSTWRDLDSDSIIQTATISISSSQILNSFTTPISIISAPGSGKFINVISINGFFDYGTVAYATDTAMFFKYNNASTAINNASWNIAQTSDKIFRFVVVNNGTGETTTLIDNQPITLSTNTANPTAGDSTMKVYITYQIVTI